MSLTICKPSLKGSRSANKIKVGSTTRSVIRPIKSTGLIILSDNYHPKSQRTIVSNTIIRVRKCLNII